MHRPLLEMDLTTSTELHIINVRSRSELDAASGNILPTFFTLTFAVPTSNYNFLSFVQDILDTFLDSDALLFCSDRDTCCFLSPTLTTIHNVVVHTARSELSRHSKASQPADCTTVGGLGGFGSLLRCS